LSPVTKWSAQYSLARCLLRGFGVERGHRSLPSRRSNRWPNHTLRLAQTEEALTVLFCLIDDANRILNPHARRYESLKRLSDSEVITLTLLQQQRGVESECSSLRSIVSFS
jgi:hypothetical protein